MPEDVPVYIPLWNSVIDYICEGGVAATKEIYDEMCHITGALGRSIKDNKSNILMEVGEPSWDSLTYIKNYTRMQLIYHNHIS